MRQKLQEFEQNRYMYANIKVLFSFNQFVVLLFCILHFCILGQTEKNMATSFSCCGNEEKDDV